MSFVELPIEINAEALIEETFDDMVAQFPGWEPRAGNPETWLIRAIAVRLIVPLAELAAEMGEEAFARFGELIVNVPPHPALAATVKSKWKVQDTAGYTIPAGTQVDVAVSGDESLGFVVVSAAPVAEGSSEAKEVLLEAIEEGEEANGIPGPASLVDAISYVTSVELEGTPSGGSTAEEPADYLDRLADTMRTLAPRPVTAEDVAILVRNIAGVQRVGVLDNYNGETETGSLEKTLSVYPLDSSGQPVTAKVAEEILAVLKARREVNFNFYVITNKAKYKYNKIDVTAELVPNAGFDKATVAAAVKAAVEAFLSPANWGQSPPGDDTSWDIASFTKLRYQDLVTAVNNVQGVNYASKLEMRKSGGSFGTADITLEGPAPLVEPGTMTITAP